ncbi:MAG: TPM domain-containing protein [Oscillospiraceae bacterium]|nr:TPM domain-containing protein [Oscillospiraceae bacterium]
MKKLIVLLVSCLLTVSLAVTAAAAGGSPKIVDNANLLTSYEETSLEEKAEALVEKYEMDVVILTVKSTNAEDITAYADDYFDYYGYGIGSDYSGVLLVLSMAEREWAISTCGETIDALSDYAQDQIMDEVTPMLGSEDYYEAFSTYLDLLDEELAASTQELNIFQRIIISLVIGAIAGGITILVMRSKMKTVRRQSAAVDYVKQGSYYLRDQRDIYLYSRTSRVRKQSSSGGTSTHRSSSGRSHGGSRGRF